MNRSQFRSFFERFRLLLKIGGKPRSRLQQIAMWLDRSSLGLPIPWKVPPLDSSAPPPVVIGATGGSGTRVMAQVLQKAGWFMGNRLNPRKEDSVPIDVFLATWLKNRRVSQMLTPRRWPAPAVILTGCSVFIGAGYSKSIY